MHGAHICVGVGAHIRRLGEDVEYLYCSSPSSLRQGLSLSLELSSACLSLLAMSTCLHLSILVHARLLYERWDLNSCPLAFTTSTLYPLSHLFRQAVLISCTHFKLVIEKMNCEKLMGVFASLKQNSSKGKLQLFY